MKTKYRFMVTLHCAKTGESASIIIRATDRLQAVMQANCRYWFWTSITVEAL